MQPVERQFSTGLPFLDRRINGGLPVGSVITLLAPPASQSQLLLRAITGEQPLLYCSTSVQETDHLKAWLADTRHQPREITVAYTPPETLADELSTYLQMAQPESFLVLDAVNPLEEASRSEYLSILNQLHQWAREQDAVVFLHCLETSSIPAHRTLTLNRVDQVWWLHMQLLSQKIENKLYITKSRNNRSLTEPISLVLSDQVQIDTTRNI